MKKFFTLCLAFMLASLLNMNAADTYTLVGDFNSWNASAEGYNFTYVEATDSYVLEDVTLKGEFKIVKNNSWDNPQFGSNGNDVPLDAAYIMWNTNSGNMKMIDGKEAIYNDCKLELKVLGAKNASLRITSSTSMQAAIDTRADVWCVAGTFSGNQWNDAYEMTDLGNGVYELWSTELPSEFKFKAKGNWDISLGMHKEIKNTPIMGFDNAVDNGGDNISLKTDKAYDLYRYTLTVRGWVASFRVDGYKEATQPVTVFYESFTGGTGTGPDDNAFNGGAGNGTFKADNDGWTAKSDKKFGANNAAKFGTSSVVGEVSSPALGLTGDATLTFKAAPWSSEKDLTISISNGSLSMTYFEMESNKWNEYTVQITNATPDAYITFTPAKRFFLDEVKVIQGDASADMKAAEITLNGVMKDAETAYYHGSLANPTVTVTLPAGATYMDVEVDNSGYITESRKNQTSDCTIPFYNAGNYTVRVTAYGEGVYSVASKDIAIETVSSVYTFDELINKGEGATCYLNFSPTVVAHIGKYLYLDGYDMWEGIRSSALVYASLDKTYKKGDVLKGFIATVSYYKGNPQLIPLTTSLGDVFGMSEPYVYEVEAGDAWKKFAVEANVNKYVRVKNAPVTANPDAVDGVAAYTKNLGVNMPDDDTKKYDVEGFINNFNGTIQIQPISFTAEEIKPFTYTEIVPANNAEVTSLSEIKITFPYNVTYEAEVGVLVMDGDKTITPSVAVEGNVATLTFDAITAYGSKPSLMVMEGAFTASGVGCEQFMAAWSIPTPPIVPTYVPTGFNPADGSVVEKIGTILIYTDDAYPEFNTVAYGDPSKYITVYDAQGNVVEGLNQYLDYASVSGGYAVKYMPNKTAGITEPGTYTFKFAEGTFGDETYYEKNHKKGRVNPEFTITYTIKGAALAAPTVDPANGAEVENLNTITLTFAEAVTANAEAGAITLVNNSNQNLDYAKNIAVAISEDGLTATITSEPSLGAWTAETYTMSIPAGYFVGASGAANEALSYNWKVVAPKFNYVAVTPAQGEVESLETIFIDFGGFRPRPIDGSMYPTYNLVNANGETVTTAATNYSYEQIDGSYYYKLKVTLGAKVTTPGDYFLTIPAGVFKDKDVYSGYNENAEMTFKWTVMEPDPNTYNFAWNVNPAEGTVEELKTIVFTAATAGQMLMPTTEAQVANWVKVTDQNGNVYNTTAKAGTGYDVTIEGATAPGTYTVVVPKASFYDLMASMSNPNSKNFNDEIVLTYTLQEEEEVDNTVYDYAPVTVSPANGSEVESLEKIYVSFPYGVYDCLWAAQEYGKDFIQVSDENGNTYEAKIGYGSYTEDYYIYVKDATAPGKYTIVVPKGLVFDEEHSETFASGHANPEFTLTYTIVAPVVEDFTPVINPTAGNVTVDQIKTTVLSFESPIASFDDSDVRYAKPLYGSVWCSVAGSYTISEDKLSLTINWDFSPEVGLTYTLELPAGCIVLENGAKNLFTQVAYTIVAGPKDLAEFVVPAGINGYINYDETDVNAWAPEFPFTVSTTAYNTVAFTAELPSLPAGITAMEVIDENGEVIAILNQDGVAPLADGEIYYVKGETTKEYVDGAELKFRFRFTHLGVSETIQFSYIIAGGNITSIADVELDGNVIVRGNDIIAPQGAAIFTVSGIRVPAEGLAPGVYVVVLGNQAVKVMVK